MRSAVTTEVGPCEADWQQKDCQSASLISLPDCCWQLVYPRLNAHLHFGTGLLISGQGASFRDRTGPLRDK